MTFIVVCFSQIIVQRTLSARNMVHAKAGALLGAALKLTGFLLFVIPGMNSRILYKGTPWPYCVCNIIVASDSMTIDCGFTFTVHYRGSCVFGSRQMHGILRQQKWLHQYCLPANGSPVASKRLILARWCVVCLQNRHVTFCPFGS